MGCVGCSALGCFFTAMYIIIIIVVLVAGKMRLWIGSG